MNYNHYLQVTGLTGPANVSGLPGAFEVLGYAFDIDAPPPTTTAGSQNTIGPAVFSDLKVRLADDAALADFLSLVSLGRMTTAASVVTLVQGDDAQPKVLQRVDLNTVFVTGVHDTQDGGYEISLGFREFAVTETFGPPGSTPVSFEFDVALRRISDVDPATPGAGAAGEVQPTRFYLLADGLNGGSVARGHEGWFELEAFDLNAANIFSLGSPTGIGSGKVQFDDLSVSLESSESLGKLLNLLARGQHLEGVRIEGVTSGDTGERVVYKLDLGTVFLTGIQENDAAGADLTMQFLQIHLQTFPLDDAGRPIPTSTFSWNVAENRTTSDPPAQISPGPRPDSPVQQPDKLFLQVSDLAGPVRDPGLAGAFEISGYSFDAAFDIALGTGGGGSLGRAEFDDLTVRVTSDAGLTDFLRLISTRRLSDGVSVVGTSGTDGPDEIVYRLNLNNAQVTRVQEMPEGGYEVSFAFQKISTVAGAGPGADRFSYDLVRNQTDVPVANAEPGPGSTGIVAPSKYFMLVNGMDGGSRAAGYEGWYELTDLDLQVLASSTVLSPMAGSRANFGELSVEVAGSPAVQGLLEAMSRGAQISGVRIEGVTYDQGQAQAVYKLNLAEVTLTALKGGDDEGFSLSMLYERVHLATRGLAPDGSLQAERTFGFDVVKNTTTVGALPTITAATNGPRFTDADTYVLQVDGFDGPTQGLIPNGYKVTNFTFGAEAPATLSSGSTTAGQVSYDFLTVEIENDAGLADFLRAVAGGLVQANASLVGAGQVTPSGDPGVTQRIDLKHITVWNVADTSEGGYVVTLGFSAIEFTSGAGPQPTRFGYDIVRRTLGVDVAPAQPGPAGADVTPTKFFLLVDGVNGGSVDLDHRGWFELDSFAFDASAVVDGSSTSIPKPKFGELLIGAAENQGLVDLLRSLALGRRLDGVRIEGVVEGEGRPTVVYKLDLAEVFLSEVRETEDGGFALAIDYGRIRLATKGIDGAGRPLPEEVFTWHVLQNRPDIGALPDIAPGQSAPANRPPVAAASSLSTAEDTAKGGEVSATDPDGQALTYSLVSGPANGTLQFAANGSYTYTPGANYAGTDSFSFRASDGTLTSAPATVSLTVTPVNDAPVASPASDVSIAEDTAFSFAVPAFSDVEGSALTYSATLADGAELPSWISFDPVSRTFSGAPPANFHGEVTLKVTASDGTLSASDEFKLIVTPVNDAPVAATITQTLLEDATLAGVLLGATDVDGDALTYALKTGAGPSKGAVTLNGGSFDYTPAANANGSDSFTVIVSDGKGGSVEQVVNLVVTPVNDAPAAVSISDTSSAEDTAFSFAVPAFSDVDGDALTYAATLGDGAALPAWISFDPVSRTFSGTPPANFNGEVALKVTASDGALSASDEFKLTVTPVNDAPAAAPITRTLLEDTALTGVPFGATDVDGDALTYAVKTGSGPSKGVVTLNGGSFDYTPAANANGPDSFTVVVSDGNGGSVEQVVNLSITPVNDAPAAPAAVSLTLLEDTPLVGVAIGATDVDGDALSYAVKSGAGPAKGVVSFQNGAFSYTPSPNANGAETFTILVSDTAGASVEQVVSLAITPVNDAPTAVDDAGYILSEDAALLLNVLANDLDPDVGDAQALVSVTSASGATVTIDRSAGYDQVRYVGDADAFDLLTLGQSQTDTLTYIMRDAAGLTSTAKATVSVTGVADAPTQIGSNKSGVLTGSAGDERLEGGNGEDRLLGLEGADRLVGQNGEDSLIGGAGWDVLDGGNGKDRLEGGAGDDTLTGGTGKDLFVYDGGHDRVTDLENGEQILVVGFGGFAALMAKAETAGADVVIRFSATSSLTLSNTRLSSLDAGDFLFG